MPDYQLSLAIGKEGQNARLAAKLTGWRIDIRPDTEAADAAAGAGAARQPRWTGAPTRHVPGTGRVDWWGPTGLDSAHRRPVAVPAVGVPRDG